MLRPWFQLVGIEEKKLMGAVIAGNELLSAASERFPEGRYKGPKNRATRKILEGSFIFTGSFLGY
jgi:hypothetical protein